MPLPILKTKSNKRFQNGIFNGIGEEGLADAMNLVCNEQCHTRKSRKAVMIHSPTPDQIIPCENRLFFRYGNTIKEMEKNENGELTETNKVYSLKNFYPAPDRKLVIWDEKLYVLPDNIRVGKNTWHPFAKNYAPSTAFPFVNSHTLYYPTSASSSEYCPEADLLKVGMKLRFSWIPTEEFTIKTLELKNRLSNGTTILEGVRITLDKGVENYKNIPQSATAEYTHPEQRPILNDLAIGYNHNVIFLGDSIIFFCVESSYTLNLNDYFKKGQMVKISGSSDQANNTTAKIVAINDTSIQLDKMFVSQTEPHQTIITISPVIPDFSHLLITEDRLFGVDNTTGKFYISALKNPFLFYDFPTVEEDPWQVKINGTATGLALWKDCVICFTEDGGFRILGYNALNFGIRQLSLNGIKKGSGNSLVRVGDTLYYFSEKGVMKYSGGSDKKISGFIFNMAEVKSAAHDGNCVYMLSNNRLWVYDTEIERWWSENAEDVTDIFKFDGKIYLNTPEIIYLSEGDEGQPVDWSFELPTFKNQNFKRLIPLYFSTDFSEKTNSDFNLYFRVHGDSNWIKCGTVSTLKEGTIKIPIPKKHCNGFKLKAEGNGVFSPESWCVCYKII